MDERTITVTWMDGITETYKNVTTSVREGVLHVHEYNDRHTLIINEWHFPTANIRVWNPVTNGNGHTYDRLQ